MYFQVKVPENGSKNIFEEKETTHKIGLIFLDVNVLTESWILLFCALPTNKQGAVSVFSVYKRQKKHWKASIAFRELKAKYQWCFSRLKCHKIGTDHAITSYTAKTAEISYLQANKLQTWYRVTYLESSDKETVALMFWKSKDSMKVNTMFLAVRKEEVCCAWYFYTVKWNKIGMFNGCGLWSARNP